MKTRAEIQAKREANAEEIKRLREENIKLGRELLLLSDEKQWFTEEIESHPKVKWQREPHPLDGKLVGRIHWKETYKDDSTNDDIVVERSRIVRVDGEWI